MRSIHLAIVITAALGLVACSNKTSSGGEGSPTSTSAPAAIPPPAATPAPVASAAPAPPVEIEITSVKNTMTFDKTKLTVPAGAQVHLTLKNNATMKTLPHNWVLVQPGTQAKVAAEGLEKAADAGYVVEGPNVLAATPLAAPGTTTEVTFTAPPAGTYPYICTVPGHYMMMKGTLTVTP
jgi:azurin